MQKLCGPIVVEIGYIVLGSSLKNLYPCLVFDKMLENVEVFSMSANSKVMNGEYFVCIGKSDPIRKHMCR